MELLKYFSSNIKKISQLFVGKMRDYYHSLNKRLQKKRTPPSATYRAIYKSPQQVSLVRLLDLKSEEKALNRQINIIEQWIKNHQHQRNDKACNNKFRETIRSALLVDYTNPQKESLVEAQLAKQLAEYANKPGADPSLVAKARALLQNVKESREKTQTAMTFTKENQLEAELTLPYHSRSSSQKITAMLNLSPRRRPPSKLSVAENANKSLLLEVQEAQGGNANLPPCIMGHRRFSYDPQHHRSINNESAKTEHSNTPVSKELYPLTLRSI